MKACQLQEAIGAAEEVIQRRLGTERFVSIVPGTGWDEALLGTFREQEKISYADIDPFHVLDDGTHVQGHQKSIRIGDIDGKNVLVLGRVHANEDPKRPGLQLASRIIIGGVKNNADGVIICNGVGHLSGNLYPDLPPQEAHHFNSRLNEMARTIRGRACAVIEKGDVAVVEDISTLSLGSYTPLVAGEFVDFYGAMHAEGDRYIDLAQRIVVDVKGRCEKVIHYFIPGPQFESPIAKRQLKSLGVDTIGMSGIQDVLAAAKDGIPFVNVVLVTNGPMEKHTHKGNRDVGHEEAPKLAKILEETVDAWPRNRMAVAPTS